MIITDEAKLRVECVDVLPEEVDSLRVTLEGELEYSYEMGRPGIGLAAPQIGINKRMAIVRLTSEHGNVYNVDLVNCKIAQGFSEDIFDNEGCLSFPGVYKRTKRYSEIYVVDNVVEPHSFIATGLFGVCIQHELDHWKGRLLPDLSID